MTKIFFFFLNSACNSGYRIIPEVSQRFSGQDIFDDGLLLRANLLFSLTRQPILRGWTCFTMLLVSVMVLHFIQSIKRDTFIKPFRITYRLL